ncbi:uncharacterized protein CTHT_0061070 [Thermochaetoides thermophila DSM 1495]|uniref:Uncharacterized protein n=1 Tax=Chaetomium thermophilum (strain DSM 1495 / CBS 144.50 / IMI 039719) TaxID=759272 RepID=G0SF76_CHATD|nr:hypothetical protein CTHT_0061070 [Thermochaetoides thermophila DSM 1495]EGS18092.1 hypothetical protein CTHT_0061070 [Thermochaetoides thermophila DSM 1495]
MKACPSPPPPRGGSPASSLLPSLPPCPNSSGYRKRSDCLPDGSQPDVQDRVSRHGDALLREIVNKIIRQVDTIEKLMETTSSDSETMT